MGEPSVHSLSVIASGRNTFFLWLELDRLLRHLRPDVIYCWEEPWCLSTWQVSRLARSLHVPLVFYTAENRPKHLPWPFPHLQQLAFRNFGCVVPTQEIAARIRASGFNGVVFEIPLWIRPRRLLKAEAGNRCLVYVGRLIPLKRVHILIESLRLLPEFRLRVIGDGPEMARLTSLAKNLGLSDRVDFRGHIDNGNLEDNLAGASLLVLPTAENSRQAEQFGKAALEGVSCGLPVLASHTGNLATLSKVLPTLVARDLDSVEQMAKAVTELWRNFPPVESLASNRIEVQRTYSSEAVALRLEAAFNSLPVTGEAT